MAEETLLLPDASRADAVMDVLDGLEDREGASWRLEESNVYPGQELALDVWAQSGALLVDYIDEIREALRASFGWRVRTTAEMDDELAARTGVA